ncbi:hypothetical protein UXW01_001805, partial [Campylobacter jejuni]|nr:hypothetical protein [Campylobacter jejuni]
PKCNEILEIVALRYENNEKIAEFSKLIKVSFLPSFITEFTGINEDMIKNCNDISQTLKEFDDFLKSGDILVAHNAHFDINFLYDNFMCYLNKPFSFDFVDTMRLSKLINQELAHHRLKDLCNQYNICYENAHRGEKDCELTHLCLMELKKTAFDNSLIENDVLVNNGLKTQIRQTQTKAKDIQAKIQEFDISHPLYNQNCVITGILGRFTRSQAMQIIADLGGINQDSVTKKTNILILGDNDYRAMIKGGISNKLKRARELILKGQDLKIISENVFYDMIF